MDSAPTVLELEHLDAPGAMSGRSMIALARGETEKDARVVVSEGRQTRGILFGKYRLLVREGAAQTTMHGEESVSVAEELFDLETDPGERKNLARERPDVVAEMRARLEAALKNTPAAGTSAAAGAGDLAAVVRLRFPTMGAVRRISGRIHAVDHEARLNVLPVGLAPDAAREVRGEQGAWELAFESAKDAVVGLDLHVIPPSAKVKWELYVDDEPLRDDRVFGGSFGFVAPPLRAGVFDDRTRLLSRAPVVPHIDPRRDFGLFVTREALGETPASEFHRAEGGRGAEEMGRLLKEWGYAHDSKGARDSTR